MWTIWFQSFLPHNKETPNVLMSPCSVFDFLLSYQINYMEMCLLIDSTSRSSYLHDYRIPIVLLFLNPIPTITCSLPIKQSFYIYIYINNLYLLIIKEIFFNFFIVFLNKNYFLKISCTTIPNILINISYNYLFIADKTVKFFLYILMIYIC
jgi:hypothetical protein